MDRPLENAGISSAPLLDPAPEPAPDSGTEARGEVEIKDPLGLHVRPTAKLAECASHFDSEIYISNQNASVNAKSTIGLLTLIAPQGSRLLVVCKGKDAPAALEAIKQLPL